MPLRIRVEPHRDREAHAIKLVAAAMLKQENYGLPMIPLADHAHVRVPCWSCGTGIVWIADIRRHQEAICLECRLANLAEGKHPEPES